MSFRQSGGEVKPPFEASDRIPDGQVTGLDVVGAVELARFQALSAIGAVTLQDAFVGVYKVNQSKPVLGQPGHWIVLGAAEFVVPQI